MDSRSRRLVDMRVFGRRWRAARIAAGIDSVEELSKLLIRCFGMRISVRSLYDYERGKTLPPLDVAAAVIPLIKPPGGWRFFLEALSPELRQAWLDYAGDPGAS